MSKKIVSFTLSKKSLERLNRTSKALGISRSELLEFMIERGWRFPDEVQKAVDEISKLQKKANAKIKEECSKHEE